LYTNFQKKEHFLCPIKRQIYVWTYHYLLDIFLSFLPMPHKMFFVVKNLCANIEYPDLHAKFIFRICWHLKLFFLCISIIGSYTPESQNTSSVSRYLLFPWTPGVFQGAWCRRGA
jgi:hypothetical protein